MELDVVADEVVDIVQVIDGSNRFLFGNHPDLYAASRSARNVIGPKPAGQTVGSGGTDV